MTVELAIFVSVTSLIFNTIAIWAIGRMSQRQREVTSRLWSRLNYLEVGMSHHHMIPLPWEMEEFEETFEETKTFKQEGNVVYLQEETKDG